jgi:hypothetical protein
VESASDSERFAGKQDPPARPGGSWPLTRGSGPRPQRRSYAGRGCRYLARRGGPGATPRATSAAQLRRARGGRGCGPARAAARAPPPAAGQQRQGTALPGPPPAAGQQRQGTALPGAGTSALPLFVTAPPCRRTGTSAGGDQRRGPRRDARRRPRGECVVQCDAGHHHRRRARPGAARESCRWASTGRASHGLAAGQRRARQDRADSSATGPRASCWWRSTCCSAQVVQGPGFSSPATNELRPACPRAWSP